MGRLDSAGPHGDDACLPGALRRLDLDRVAHLGADQRAAERRVGRDTPDARDLDLEAASLLVLDLHDRADPDGALLSVLDDDGVLDPAAQDRDPPLEQALLVLRVVVGEVLGEVAEAACRRDRLHHLGALGAFELGELGCERVALRDGHRFAGTLGHRRIVD